jgi:hypothetical protein
MDSAHVGRAQTGRSQPLSQDHILLRVDSIINTKLSQLIIYFASINAFNFL